MASKHLFIDIQTPAPAAVVRTEDEIILVRDQVADAEAAIEAKAQIDIASAKLEKARKVLEPIAQELQRKTAKQGMFSSKVQFQGSESRATFTFTNAFSSLDTRMKPPLVKSLGPDVTDHLFESKERITLRGDKAEELHKLLEAQGLDPSEFLETDKCLQFQKDFRRKRFDLRANLSDAQNDTLDVLMDQASSRPSLTTK